jgi:hypothetical protein
MKSWKNASAALEQSGEEKRMKVEWMMKNLKPFFPL